MLNAGHAVTVDRLVDIVWEKPPASARRQIQDLVSRLRPALADAGADNAVITTVRGGYASHRQAVACFARALELLGHVGDRYGKAETLLLLGDAYKAIGEPGESVRAWQEACEVLVELNHPDVERALTRLD
ncbi:winged helix-turn-helix domain-containing protein [Nonomuraea longispora]|uniref:winged helix-turn-helix domain-containing protein n=1 Tax=Nonomuraea longispora TaxID=1848320 RepID=UPI003CCC6CAA